MYIRSTPPSLIQSSTVYVSNDASTSPHHNTTLLKHMSHSSDSVVDPYAAEPMMEELLSDLSTLDESIAICNHGYQLVDKICDTLQGELFKAVKMNNINSNQLNTNHSYNTHRHQHVAIKKIHKSLAQQSIALQEDITFCVSENIVQEAQILKYLTVDHSPIGEYIVKYIDFFESHDYYYLVTEHVSSQTNLKQFVSKAKQYIHDGRLSLKEYHKMIKFVLWQLFVTVEWLHVSMKCCHLDLCLENILLHNAEFVENKRDGKMTIHGGICVKLCDFGVAEVFAKDIDYLCCKQPLSLDNTAYSAPTVYDEEIYDAESADNWALGMILYECLTVGEHIYKPLDIHDGKKGGYWALKHHQLKRHLAVNNTLRYFNMYSFSVLVGLLAYNERKRWKGIDVLKHKWFSVYYKRYERQIKKKFSKHGHGLVTKHMPCLVAEE